MEDKTGDRP
jgi:hypothetical protein